MVKLSTKPVGERHVDQIPAMPSGSPSARDTSAAMALPERQSGSNIDIAGIMQRWPFLQASRNVGFSGTITARAYACINLAARLFRAKARTNRGGCRARFNTQLAKDMLKVFVDGARTHAKYLSDVAVGFSFCKPR